MLTTRLSWNLFLVSVILVFITGCSSGIISPGSPDLNWTYQEDDRRLNFKNVQVIQRNDKRVIVGTVENVGDENWPNPTVNFSLLNRNKRKIGTASTSRANDLTVGSKWNFEVIPRNQDFYRPRFADPTGW